MYSNKIIKKLTSKFKDENDSLNDTQIQYYIEQFHKYKDSNKILEKDIMKYSFYELEKIIDQIPKSKSYSSKISISQEDIIFEDDNLLILNGNTKEKCIKYGKGYSWCISRNDSSNMFNSYRYMNSESIFYFVFDKKDKSYINHAIVIRVDKYNKLSVANTTNNGQCGATTNYTFDEIVKHQPLLKDKEYLFKSSPLSKEEKDIYDKIHFKSNKDNLLETLGKYIYLEAYISFGHILTDKQYELLDDDLKMKYINLGNLLSDNQLNISNTKIKERYEHITSLQYYLDFRYNKEEQKNILSLDIEDNILNLKGIDNLPNLMLLRCRKNIINNNIFSKNLYLCFIFDKNDNIELINTKEFISKFETLELYQKTKLILDIIDYGHENCTQNKFIKELFLNHKKILQFISQYSGGHEGEMILNNFLYNNILEESIYNKYFK